MLKKTPFLIKDINFWVINIISLTVYIVVFMVLNAEISTEIMFWTHDSKTYLTVKEWISGGADTENIYLRPILYPIILLISSTIGGIKGIWLTQIFFWLASINLTFYTVRKLTNKLSLAYVASLILVTNFSLLALTFNALTEVTTVFLLSILIHFIVKNSFQYKKLEFIHGIILMLSLLNIVKPLFTIPLYFVLFFILPVFYFKEQFKSKTKIFKLLLVLLPLIIQISIIKTKYNEFKVSNISTITLNNYIIAQGVEKAENISREESKVIANNFTKSEKTSYITSHLSIYLSVYVKNLKDNIKGYPNYVAFPDQIKSPVLIDYMFSRNKLIFTSHILVSLLIIPVLLMLILRKEKEKIVLLFVLTFITSYLILTTGVSNWQGDRLVIPAIAVWPILYCFIIQNLLKRKA